MSKKFVPLFVLAGAALLSVGVIRVVNSNSHSHVIDEAFIDDNGNITEPMDIATHTEHQAPEGKYEENVVLVKSFEEINSKQIGLDVLSIDELYPNSQWKKITFKETSSFDAVQYLRNTNLFEKVDYNYIMEAEVMDTEAIDVSSNPYAEQLSYIESNGVGNAWAWGHYKHNHGEENIDAGGSPDVVIAVIDTGVDYNHVDLRNNIWTNTAEIPDNGVDDDSNGYIDDVHGWDCVNEDKDPMDDNGHGTHVAGIAAAENNNIGTVGVAFNCKIMPIKAGSSSGYFTNDDIAQAVQYAYMNGASVINMSFGGSAISMSVEDALSSAYYQCVLVAAAGNNGICNQPDCTIVQHIPHIPFYPAALPYVVGVMSCNDSGHNHSLFSNFDHFPYNEYEYDCYACGEQIMSTWPNNRYAKLSGTSMASPVVAGIAALIRSAYPDRDTFSNKYIHSQLTNTGSNYVVGDSFHPVCDAYEALTNIPTPHIYNLYRFYAFDNEEFSPNNNGDGFIDAGETIRLGIELQNRGGKATNVTARIDTIRNGDPNITDPALDIIEDTIHMDEIGTYSIQDGGKIYEDDKVVNMTNAFVININPNTQNGYICEINLHLEYYNGLDETDHTKYTGNCYFDIAINRGYRISGTISEDTIFSADKLYLIDDIVTISESATVTFEAGCQIEFFSNDAQYIDNRYSNPALKVYGNLIFAGTEDNQITIKTSQLWDEFLYEITTEQNGLVAAEYTTIQNCRIKYNCCLNHCSISYPNRDEYYKMYSDGNIFYTFGTIFVKQIENSILDIRSTQIQCSLSGTTANNNLFLIKNGTLEMSNAYIEGIYNPTLFKDNLLLIEQRKSSTSIIFNGQNNFSLVNNQFVLGFVPNKLKDMPKICVDEYDKCVNNYGNVVPQIYLDNMSSLFANNVKTNGELKIRFDDYSNHDDSII